MAVTRIKPVPGGRRATLTRDQPLRIEAEYLADTSNQHDGLDAVLTAMRSDPANPWFGRPYNVGNDYAFIDVESIGVEESSGLEDNQYHVSVSYQNKEDEDENQDDQGDQFDDPLKEPYRIESSFSTETKAVEKALYISGFSDVTTRHFNLRTRDGDSNTTIPINSAGDAFVPGLTDVEYIETIRITKNVKTDPLEHTVYLNTPNKKTWTLSIKKPRYKRRFYPNTIKLIGLPRSWERKNGVDYVRVTYIFAVNINTWDDEILDRGLNERRADGDPDGLGSTISLLPIRVGPEEFAPLPIGKERIKSEHDDYPISTPVNLDGNGQRLKAGKDAVYVKYRKRELMDYRKLKI